MPRGVYDRNPAVAEIPDEVGVAPVKMLAMKLERHYRPRGDYEVVGYLKKAVSKKFPDGTMKIVEPEEFIPGEQAPAPFPGVISTGKVWAQTTIKLPEDEAKSIAKLGIASRDFDD